VEAVSTGFCQHLLTFTDQMCSDVNVVINPQIVISGLCNSQNTFCGAARLWQQYCFVPYHNHDYLAQLLSYF